MWRAYDGCMDVVEIIRNANSAPQVLSALSAYLESLNLAPMLPEWCFRPMQGEADVRACMAALFSVVNLTSKHGLARECGTAKRALHVFAAALQRLKAASRFDYPR
jgi:hypothetical protein